MTDPTTPAPPPQDDPQGLSAALAKSSDAFGNLSMSSDQLASLKGDLGDSEAAEDAITGAQIKNDSAQFKGEAPKEDPHMLGGLMPLLAIGAFAGKATKLSASAMLGASIGMTNGYLNGKEGVYQDNKKKFDQAYQEFKDRQAQQDKIYNEMKEAYKGRIDADIKALQFAREVTNDQAQNQATLLRDNETVKQHAEQVHHWQEEMDETKHEDRVKEHFEQAKLDLARQQTGANISNEAASLAADRILNGEKASDVLGNMGRGKQGAADIAMVNNLVASRAQAMGMSAEDIATKKQELAAEARTRLELGAREGKIAPRVQEAQNFAGLALQASEQVPRGNWLAATKLMQKGETQSNDPKLAAFLAANNSLINAYAAAVGGGVMHVHDQEKAESMLSTVQSPDAYRATVQQLLKETQGALDAPQQVMGGLRKPTPVAPAEAPGASNTAPPAQPTQPPPQSQPPAAGNVVHWSELPTGNDW